VRGGEGEGGYRENVRSAIHAGIATQGKEGNKPIGGY